MFEFFDKLFGKEKTYRETYEHQMKKQQKIIDSVIKDKIKRLEMQGECKAVLEECKLSFQGTINTERARALQLQQDGFDSSTEESRIRECAIGILIVNEATQKLQSITSESQVNATMNRLGMALRQINRMDNSGAAISGSTWKVLEKWFPGVLAQLGDGTETQYTIPEDMRNRVDTAMLADLLSGDDFDVASYKAKMRAKVSGTKQQENTAKLDQDIANAMSVVQKFATAEKKEDIPNVSDLTGRF